MVNLGDENLAETAKYLEKGKEAFRGTGADPYDILTEYAEEVDTELDDWLVDREGLESRDPEYFEDFKYALKALDRKARREE